MIIDIEKDQILDKNISIDYKFKDFFSNDQYEVAVKTHKNNNNKENEVIINIKNVGTQEIHFEQIIVEVSGQGDFLYFLDAKKTIHVYDGTRLKIIETIYLGTGFDHFDISKDGDSIVGSNGSDLYFWKKVGNDWKLYRQQLDRENNLVLERFNLEDAKNISESNHQIFEQMGSNFSNDQKINIQKIENILPKEEVADKLSEYIEHKQIKNQKIHEELSFEKKQLQKQILEELKENKISLTLEQKLWITEIDLMLSLGEELRNDLELTHILLDIVLNSKKYASNSKESIAAANAITLLNYAKYSFSGKDLSEIKIRGADLSYAIMDHVNLEGADLENVIFREAFLRNANLKNSNMAGVVIGKININDGRINSIYEDIWVIDMIDINNNKDNSTLLLNIKTGKKLFISQRYSWYYITYQEPIYLENKHLLQILSTDGIYLINLLSYEISKIEGKCIYNENSKIILKENNQILIWDTNNQKILSKIKGQFCKQGVFILENETRSAIFLDKDTLLFKEKIHIKNEEVWKIWEEQVDRIRLYKNENRIILIKENQFILLNSETGEVLKTINTDIIFELQLIENRIILTNKNQFILLNSETGEVLKTINTDIIFQLQLIENKAILKNDNQLILLDLETVKIIFEYLNQISLFEYLIKQNVFFIITEGVFKIFNLNLNQKQESLIIPIGTITRNNYIEYIYSLDEKRLLITHRNEEKTNLFLFDLETGKELKKIEGKKLKFVSLENSKNKNEIVINRDNELIVLNTISGEEILKIPQEENFIQYDIIYSGDYPSIKIYPKTGKKIKELLLKNYKYYSNFYLSSDEEKIIFTGHSNCLILDISTGKELMKFEKIQTDFEGNYLFMLKGDKVEIINIKTGNKVIEKEIVNDFLKDKTEQYKKDLLDPKIEKLQFLNRKELSSDKSTLITIVEHEGSNLVILWDRNTKEFLESWFCKNAKFENGNTIRIDRYNIGI